MRQPRLAELYPIGCNVSISFEVESGLWLDGRVVAHDARAVWVELGDGQRFFVTNRRRIRPRQSA